MYRGETELSREVYVSPAGLVVSIKERKREKSSHAIFPNALIFNGK